MSSTLARFSCDPARGGVPTEAVLPALLSALAELPRSVDPAVVLTGLARLCVPLCCDGCAISIDQPDQPGHRLHWPPVGAELDGPVEPDPAEHRPLEQPKPAAEPGDYQLDDHELRVPFQDPAGGFRGSMAWTFRRHRPTDGEALLAQLALDRAVATIHTEQLRSRAEAATELAANLQVALASSREIGMAMGIVMDRHKLSSDQAFQLLTRISQHRQRRVREIAVEIAETGVVELPKGHQPVPAKPAPA